MIQNFLKNSIIFLMTLFACAFLLFMVCLIPQNAIAENCLKAEEYFSSHEGFPLLMENNLGSRIDNYADCALFNVIYNIDSEHALYSMIEDPYYRIENNDIREDYRSAVIEGKEPNTEYSRYWHGSQVFLRPLLLFTSIEGCRAILFGFLLVLNLILAVLLLQRKWVIPLAAYIVALVVVQFWMAAFSLEYIMTFLVMTCACIAVIVVWNKTTASGKLSDSSGEDFSGLTEEVLERRITAICIVSGVVTCFLDFLTTETITFTVPILLLLLLHKESGKMSGSFKGQIIQLIKWGIAWLSSYAMMFAIKWGAVLLMVGKSAFFNAMKNAAERMEGDVATGEEMNQVASTIAEKLPMLLARNLGCLFPFSQDLTVGAVFGLTIGILLLAGALLYLFRGERVDGAFMGILLLIGIVPYLRFVCLSNHSYIHYFFTYRAQMATVMALFAVMAYNLKPSYILHGYKGNAGKGGRRNSTGNFQTGKRRNRKR